MILDAQHQRACPVCSTDEAETLAEYSPAPWVIAACKSCGFVYLRNPPAYQALVEDFAWEKTHGEKKETGRGSTRLSPLIRKLRAALGLTHRDKSSKFRRWFHDGHVLDIGCGHARRIKPPMTPYGIELSAGLQEIADAEMRQHGGYCLHGAGAEAIWDFPEKTFDGILMHSYLEHETDVMGVLRGAHRALKDDGGAFIRVPNFASINRRVVGPNWCGFRYPDHVNYFTLSSLRDVGARAGFTTQLVNRLALPFDDNISVLLRKAPGAARKA